MEPAFYPIICITCEKILNKPVLLPCGHSICQHHVDEAKTSNRDLIKCYSCTESHAIPERGFTSIKNLEALIENKIHSLDLGEDYQHPYNLRGEFERFIELFERIKNQPENRIHDYISSVKNKIDLKREKLKNEIDQKFLSMIEKLDEFENECIANVDWFKLRFDDNLDEKLKKWKIKSEQLFNDLRSFEKCKWKRVKEEASLHIKEVRSELYDMDESLFLNRLIEIRFPNWGISEVSDTISIEVEGVSKIKEDFAKSVENLELGLRLLVQIKNNDSSKNELWVGINLESKIGLSIRKPKVEYELVLLNRFDDNKSVKKSHVIEFTDNVSSWVILWMRLDDLLNNDDIYDPEKDSFTAKAIIKNIEWIKPY